MHPESENTNTIDTWRRRPWWDADVTREGRMYFFGGLTDAKVQFLRDHPECLHDAPYEIEIHELHEPEALLALNLPLYAAPTWADDDLIRIVESVGPQLFGIQHYADWGGRLEQNPSVLHGLSELRVFDIQRFNVHADAMATVLSTLESVEHIRLSNRRQLPALDAVVNPHRVTSIDASQLIGACLGEAPLRPDELEHLVRFGNLRSLDLSGNQILDSTLEPLAGMSSIEELHFLSPRWPDADWSFLGDLRGSVQSAQTTRRRG